eukprot:7881427-Pyramimonas_sp.AAC.1
MGLFLLSAAEVYTNPRVQGANRSAGMGIYPTQEPIAVQTWVYIPALCGGGALGGVGVRAAQEVVHALKVRQSQFREPITVHGLEYTRGTSQSQCVHGYIPAFCGGGNYTNPRDQGANRSTGMGIYPVQEPIPVHTWVYTCRSAILTSFARSISEKSVRRHTSVCCRGGGGGG